ncbi:MULTISPECIES: HDOD domain-containing protein [unclassified Acidovorax]|uniref:EAL and HDOD domain-containing protein n=1 Tax=unclassified Acidovorax TaxID=2684926 RepID=UPI0023DE368A|nr:MULTISPECIES: HDOD domain-containing protein [unclassified Acidovorax]GKS82609.1 HDOD domain-containing protein [Acidovorax sp. SUPP1855]GKS90473.1 HDOD domain-containing protein [Acidovorax sp. SUPP2539]GKS94198.1 HDOD domain-containing protein [Acidovorax sp. SUPP2825]GKT00097.1 HDOD domain-containing protein [Acidovorax sp. SUPP3434]
MSSNSDNVPAFENTAPQGEDEDSSNLAIIARQAIVDEQRAVFGYELFDRSTASDAHTAASDAALLFNALSYAGTEALVGKKTVFINCTHESLAGGHLELIHPEKVVLEVPPLADGATAEEIEGRVSTLEGLRTRGFRLAFNQNVLRRTYASWLPLAAFVKLDMQAFRAELAEPLVKFARANSKATLVAEKVETAEQHERMSALGVKLFQGYWFAQPALVKAQTIRPSQATIIQLINLVRKQASTAEIEELLKKDPTLSFNLLRFINSSGFGLSCEVTSFRHAVMILGLKKLFRWAALLMTTSRAGGSPPAVGQTAVVRGRLMELLAAELLPPEECDNAFVVGVFSLLDTMLGVPLEKALDSVALPQPVIDALLHNTGVFAPFLELTKACESGDEVAFARSADALHLSNRQVNWAHLQALTWAESLGE